MITDKHVLAVVGPSLPLVAATLNLAVEAQHTPLVAISETGKHVVGDCAGGCTYVFRDCLGEAAAIPANVKTAVGRSHPRSGAIFYAGDYTPSVEALDTFKQAFADNGIAVSADATARFSKHDTDFKALVAGVLALRLEIVAVSGLSDNPGAILTEARAQGYSGPVVGDDSFNRYAASKMAGKAGLGAQSGSGYWVGAGDAANQAFVQAYGAKYKDSSGAPELPDEVAAQAYSAILILAEAARGANLSLTDPAGDRNRMRSALERVSLATPMGEFSFSASHDAHQAVWVNAMDGKGGFVNVASVAAG
jgi:branched-chain amino acid transport system substrate-binding protein